MGIKVGKIKLLKAGYHVLAWTVFFAYELSFLYFSGIPQLNADEYILHFLVNVALFYSNLEAFHRIAQMPRRSLLWLLLVVGVELLVYLQLQQLVYRLLAYIHSYPPAKSLMIFSVREVYRFIYFTLLSTGYWMVRRVGRQQRQILSIDNSRLKQEAENKALENAYLVSQLNPHLLFNTLSFIYNQVRKLSADAAEAVVLLSDMMRYALSSPDSGGKVSLEEEIEHLRNMVKLNQLRAAAPLYIQLEFGVLPAGAQIVPLLLLTYVENMFKHGELGRAESPARVSGAVVGNAFIFTTRNLIKTAVPMAGWGIGLENTRRRLDAFYGQSYHLQVDSSGNYYFLELSLPLFSQ